MMRRMRVLVVAFPGAAVLPAGSVGTPAVAAEGRGTSTQGVQAVGNTIRSNTNGKCPDILGFDNSNGAVVGMWGCYAGGNQLWY